MNVVDCLPTGKRCPPLKIPISVEALWIARRSESRWSTSSKKDRFLERRRRTHHREPSPRGGRPALCGTNSFTMRSQQPMRSPVARNVRSGLRSRARNSAGSRASASQTEARIPVHIWAVPARDEHGIVVGGQQSFEDRHRHEKAEPREEGAKDSGYADEITGIDSRTIMQSRLPETLRSCMCLSASCT